MAPSSGGAAHDYMHKLKYILDTTPELSLPKVPAFTQVPYFTVWVDGKKSMLRFPYAEGNHFVTELRHAVMREFRYRGAPIDAHVTNGTGLSGRDCFLCSHVWRQGSRYGVCFSVALKQPLSHPAPDAFCDVGTARDGSKHWDNRTMSDDAAAGDCSSSSCSPPLEEGTHNPSGSADDGRGLLVCEHPSVDTVAQAFESSALRLCAARPTCAAASHSGSATALQDSSLFAGGGQFFYDAETTQDFQCPEHVELIQDNHIAGGSSTLADTSCVEHDTRLLQPKQLFLYVRIYQKYVTKAAWKDILASPQRAFHNWIAQQHLKVQDSWGWAKEQVQGEDSKIYALFRVPEAEVTAFVALSGRDGFFVDPPRWTTFPAFSVQWADKEAKETDITSTGYGP
eukprot:s905_g21.t1